MRKAVNEEKGSKIFVNKDSKDKVVLKEGSMGEGLERKSERQIIDSDEEEEGHFLNKYYSCSSIKEKWLDEPKYEEHSKEEQDQNNTYYTTYVMDEHVNSNVQNDKWANRDASVVTECTGQSHTKQRETNNDYIVPLQKWDNSVDQHENEKRKEVDMYGEKETFDDYPGNTGSPTVSILTSGYGTYRPDTPKDDLDAMDYRDDCTLTGLEEDIEYSNVVYCEDDNSQFTFEHSVFFEASEQQTTLLSITGSECSTLNHCSSSEGVTVQHNVNDSRGISEENRLGSSDVHKENDQALYFAAKSVDLRAREETNGIPSDVLRKGNHKIAYGSNEWEANTKYEDYHHPFNLRLRKSVTLVEHTNEHGLARKEKRKTKKAKSQFFKCEPISELEQRLDHLRVSASHGRRELGSESEETGSYSDRHSSATELPSAFQAYIKGMTRSRSESDIRPRPKSFIRPVMDHPHTRNLKKTDPVAKYFQYKQNWEMFKPPGEKSRKELHWAIREQLMYQPPPPKPQRTYVPNTYVVPTEKKRSALRWEIRHDLANGIIPTKITYP